MPAERLAENHRRCRSRLAPQGGRADHLRPRAGQRAARHRTRHARPIPNRTTSASTASCCRRPSVSPTSCSTSPRATSPRSAIREHRPTVMDLVRKVKGRVYPVGRLDWASEGLLLLTNDGALANALMKAASHVPKTYVVKVAGAARRGKARQTSPRSFDRRKRWTPSAHRSRARSS